MNASNATTTATRSATSTTTTTSTGTTPSTAFAMSAAVATIYVDGRIAVERCADYAPAERRCGDGADTAYRGIAAAAQAAEAGDVVELRGGRYEEQLIPARSGGPDAPLTFRGAEGERALIEGASLDPAIDISGRRHIVIENLEIDGVRRWLWALDTHHSRIEGSTFRRALHTGGSAKTGLFFQDATYNRILDNHIEDSTQDNVALIRSSRNLVAGNTIRKAAHVLWVIKCGSFNVIRGNDFHNEDQKIGEIYDCWDVGFDKEIRALNATKHNLVEDNDFAYVPSSGDSSPYSGIQYAGQEGIIRRNRFFDTVGPGLSLTLYGDEATFNTGNRVFHNVFHASDFAGIEIASSPDHAFRDNVITNNVLAQSRFVANDRRWPWYVDELDGKPVQLKVGRLDGFRFDTNALYAGGSQEPYLITYGQRTARDNPPPRSIAAWEAEFPALFGRSIVTEPRFVDAPAHDFALRADSPLIDAGTFLTRATADGSGTRLPVQDTGFFFDGFGIADEVGDEIQLEGTVERARVLEVDAAAGELVLDRSLAWRAGQGVTLRYEGDAPDIGASEHVAGLPSPSPSPTPVRSQTPPLPPTPSPEPDAPPTPMRSTPIVGAIYLPVLHDQGSPAP